MRRSIRSEITVAATTLVVLTFAIIFGVVLSTSTTPEVTADATGTLQADEITRAPQTAHVTADTAQTGTAAPAAAQTDALTPEESPSADFTLDAAPMTADASAATTDAASPTVTPSRTASRTPRPPTATAAPTFTRTPRPSPTDTATASATPTPIQDGGIQPTVFDTDNGIRPTPTPPFTPVPTLPPAAGICTGRIPDGWTQYTVEPGQTLFGIAQAVNSTVVELLRVNCLSDADSIRAGDTLYLPTVPASGVPPGLPRFAGDVCLDTSSAGISSPVAGSRAQRVMSVVGRAVLPDFWYYRLEVRADAASVYDVVALSQTPVAYGALGDVDTTRYPNGLLWIRLTVVSLSGSVPFTAICTIAVSVDN